MNAYIYRADLYCEDCIQKIKADLGWVGERWAEHTYDSDEYPKGPLDDGGGEADAPNNCGGCDVFLENPLTGDGVEYVRGLLDEHIKTGRGNREALQEWAEFYADYLDDDDTLLDYLLDEIVETGGRYPGEEEDEDLGDYTRHQFYDWDTFERFLRGWNLHLKGSFVRPNLRDPVPDIEWPHVGWVYEFSKRDIVAYFKADVVPSLLTK